MRDALDVPTTGAIVFHYADALHDRPFGRGFGLIEDDIYALTEHALHIDTTSDADSGIRRVTACR
jgi:hypothetical protein